MYTTPSITEVIQAVLASLSQDVAPELKTAKSQMSLQMAQALLQSAIQRIQRETQVLVAEHNEMITLYRTLGEKRRGEAGEGDAAARIRQRGETLGARAELAAPLTQDALAAAHRELSEALILTLQDLDELIRTGDSSAVEELKLVRAHLAARAARDMQTLVPNPGSFVGRA